MTRTVIALYDSFDDANGAIRELVGNGFDREDISLIAGDSSGEYGKQLEDKSLAAPDISGASKGAEIGAGIGAVFGGLGGLLVGLGALVIPGIGPVVAAGPLAVAIAGLAGAGAGALTGGVAGGLIGALVDVGVPEQTAQYYMEGVRRGGMLVTIRTDDNSSSRAVNIMNRHNPVDINARSAIWRAQGLATREPIGVIPGEVDQSEPRSQSSQTSGITGEDREVNDRKGEMADTAYQPGHPEERTAVHGSEDESGYGTQYRDFNYYDPIFQNHFLSFYGTTRSYEQYRPVYRYGYDLATDPRYASRDWMSVEPEAHRYWEERQPGSWDEIKDAIRHAWDEVKSSF